MRHLMTIILTPTQAKLIRELLVTNPIQPQIADEVAKLLVELQRLIDDQQANELAD